MGARADVVVEGEGRVRGVSTAYQCPSVIRLRAVIRRPRPRVRLSKREVFRRDRYVCAYCGRRVSQPTVDHVLPRHRGGQSSWDNLVTACPRCNRIKGGRTPEEANLVLRWQPTEPRSSMDYLFGAYIEREEGWREYIHGW